LADAAITTAAATPDGGVLDAPPWARFSTNGSMSLAPDECREGEDADVGRVVRVRVVVRVQADVGVGLEGGKRSGGDPRRAQLVGEAVDGREQRVAPRPQGSALATQVRGLESGAVAALSGVDALHGLEAAQADTQALLAAFEGISRELIRRFS